MGVVGLFTAVHQPITTSFISKNGWRFAYIAFGSITFVVVYYLVLLLDEKVDVN